MLAFFVFSSNKRVSRNTICSGLQQTLSRKGARGQEEAA